MDRYVSGSARAGSNRGGRGDGYRPGYRSPSPRAYRDRYDDRYRARSRSPPAYGRRARSPSPPPRRDVDDDLPLPRRAPRDVPDVQILVLDSLDRDFISWVENAFSSRAVRVDVLLLSPRLSEQAVVRRQIVEGVFAVVKLTRGNQSTAKIGLQIFDRRGGVGNVKFEEYDGLDPPIAVELVLRAKVPPTPVQSYSGYGGAGQQYGAPLPSAIPPTQQQYGGYGAPQQTYAPQPAPAYPPPAYAQPPPPQPQAAPPPSLQSLITNLDPNNLQNLLSAMGGTPQAANSAVSSANPYGSMQSQQNSAIQHLQNNPALAGYLQQQAQAVPVGGGGGGGGGQVNMQEILARLGQGQGYQP